MVVQRWFILLFALLTGFFATLASAAMPVLPSPYLEASGRVAVAPYAALLEDPSGDMSVDAVRQAFREGRSQPAPEKSFNLGYSPSVWWVGFYLQESNLEHSPLLLELAFPSLDHVAFFAPDTSTPLVTGDLLPFAQRPLLHRHFVFPLEAAHAAEPQLVLLRLKSVGSLSVPLTLWEPSAFIHASRISYAALAFYFGGLLALLLYNLLLWLRMRERIYLDYVLFSGGLALGLAGFNGLGFEFLWPNQPQLAHLSFPVGFALCTFGVAQFTRSFLSPSLVSPLLDITLKAASLLAVLTAITLIFISYEIGATLLTFATVSTTLLAIGCGVYCLIQGVPSARIYLLAWSIFLLFGVAFSLRNHGLVPTNILSLYGLHLGSMLGLLLLSFALADQLYVERKARQQAEIEARLAQHDALTGLPSRALFSERLQDAMRLADRNTSKLALIYLDLDHFKPVNDSYGHATGDKLLCQVAGRIHQLIRESDTLARIGGDEFVVLLINPDSINSVLHLAEKMRDALQQPFEVEQYQLKISASFGVALYPDHGQDEISLFKQADDAMYQAKHAGKDQICSSSA